MYHMVPHISSNYEVVITISFMTRRTFFVWTSNELQKKLRSYVELNDYFKKMTE